MHGSRTASLALAALLVLILDAGLNAQLAPGIAVRDSSGVTIVDVSEPAFRALPEWRMSPEPELRIGDATPGPTRFAQIARLETLSDGSFAVVDQISLEVRVFDSAGRFVRTIGGKGDEVGRFARAPFLQPAADGGFAAYDEGAKRVTRFSATGEVLESWIWDASAQCPFRPVPLLDYPTILRVQCSFVGLLGDGTLVAKHEEEPADDAPVGLVSGLRTHVVYVRGDSVRTVATVPLPPVWAHERKPRSTRMLTTALYAERPRFQVGPDRVVITFRNDYEMRVLGRTGALERIVRVHLPRIAVTDADLAATVQVSTVPPELRVTATRPLISATGPRLGVGNALWVADFRFTPVTGPNTPVHYTVFGADGVPLGRIEFPALTPASGPAPTDYAVDRYMWVAADPSGSPRIEVFRIEKLRR